MPDMIPLILAAILADAGVCAADWDRDGTTTVLDWLGFHAAWEAGDIRADFDNSGEVTNRDALAYIEAWWGCIE